MPKSCCAVNCTNHNMMVAKFSFFKFPSTNLKRWEQWVAAVQRINADGSKWKPSKQTVLCSAHFISGQPNKDPTHPDYIPSIFNHNKLESSFDDPYRYLSKKRKRKISLLQPTQDTPEQIESSRLKQNWLFHKISLIKMCRHFDYKELDEAHEEEHDKVHPDTLYAKLGIHEVTEALCTRRLRCMDDKRQLIYSAISSHHSSNILEKLYFQFREGRNCDLEIRIKDGYIFAHKCLVEIFFLQVGFQLENDRFVLDLTEYNEDVVTSLLDMIYTGELRILPHQIRDVQVAADQLGYSEAEKGCKIYLSNCSTEPEYSDTMQYTVVKQEPLDESEYQPVSDDFCSKQELQAFASKYVGALGKRLADSSESSPSLEPSSTYEEPPKMSSVSTSKNIYEIVKGQPKEIKLPNIVVMTANKISSNKVQATVDTAPADPKERDPYLLVSRREDGTMVLKKEMSLKKGIRDIVEGPANRAAAAKAKDEAIKDQTGKKKKSSVVPVMLTKAKTGENCDVYGTVPARPPKSKSVGAASKSTGQMKVNVNTLCQKSADTGIGTSCDFSDEESGQEPEESSVSIKQEQKEVEEEVSPSKRPQRAKKRPVVYIDDDYADYDDMGLKSKSKRGRQKKPEWEKEMEKEYKQILRAKEREKVREEYKGFYRRRAPVVINKQEVKLDSLKLIEPAGVVPEGCRSRYGRPSLMKTKFITETVQDTDGTMSVRTKEVPMRMTWHERQAEEKKKEEPTFVICHPTAPVVRT